MPRILLAAVFSLGLVGCARAGGSVLGKDPGKAAAMPVSGLKSGVEATISGVMYEKCPAAGCWFMLRDKSGVVRVDTKGAGFTVTDVPVNTRVTVCGKVKDNGEKVLDAAGLRY